MATERKFRPDAIHTETGALDSWKHRVLIAYAQRDEDRVSDKYPTNKDIAHVAYAEKLSLITDPVLLAAESRKCTIHTAELGRIFLRDIEKIKRGEKFVRMGIGNSPEILAEIMALYPGRPIDEIAKFFIRPDLRHPKGIRYGGRRKMSIEPIRKPVVLLGKNVESPAEPVIITRIIELGNAWKDDCPEVSRPREGKRGSLPPQELVRQGLESRLRNNAQARSAGLRRISGRS